ncbi:mevalonate kinase [Weissella uvarum]|uniref:mevalonate kinase n=1 Tax=Weissella uvarum TaxID=1479233 RepID=UPI00195FB9DD|nr:mevalonate kinase [Weissella uvarum]MBM7617461.1 mevalonate kinase [Weissella uvarum]MCM0595654.1 mevalonate kinase [Weissella uvarum]
MKSESMGKSHAKVILIGDHSVVYGQPAIAIPLPDLAMTATLKERQAGQVVLTPNYQGPMEAMGEVYEGVRQLITHLLTYFDAVEMPFTLEIESKIPQERGMGSSAASAIAIIRAFFDFFETPLSDQDLQKWANIEEAVTHGSPSGLDAATSASDVPVWFIKNETIETLQMNLEGYLIIADTGIRGQTGLAVSVVRQQMETKPKETQNHIEALGAIAYQMRNGLSHDDLHEIGQAMTDAHTHLKALGVSHPSLDRLVEAAIAAGAIGAKLTGGGVGGAMLALTETKAQAQAVIKALQQAGAQETWSQHYHKK